jgi:hypothetical protein
MKNHIILASLFIRVTAACGGPRPVAVQLPSDIPGHAMAKVVALGVRDFIVAAPNHGFDCKYVRVTVQHDQAPRVTFLAQNAEFCALMAAHDGVLWLGRAVDRVAETSVRRIELGNATGPVNLFDAVEVARLPVTAEGQIFALDATTLWHIGTKFLRSVDGGATWVEIGPPPQAYPVAPGVSRVGSTTWLAADHLYRLEGDQLVVFDTPAYTVTSLHGDVVGARSYTGPVIGRIGVDQTVRWTRLDSDWGEIRAAWSRDGQLHLVTTDDVTGFGDTSQGPAYRVQRGPDAAWEEVDLGWAAASYFATFAIDPEGNAVFPKVARGAWYLPFTTSGQ